MQQRTAMVIGAGGFIGHNLVKRLKSEGWHVVGVDKHPPRFEGSPANEFMITDAAANRHFIQKGYDRIYQLGADMGGAGHVFTGENDAEILSNSFGINQNVLLQVKKSGVGRIFYSSSVCCYPDAVPGREEDAYPANPPSAYGWEKLTSEKLFLAYAKQYGIKVRIARFHNCFGPLGTYEGGREKFPAALCRKVALVKDGGSTWIWGDGKQLRPFIFIEDLLDGIEALMSVENFQGPVNLGPDDSKTIPINEMIRIIGEISGKTFTIENKKGPTGGSIRHANNDLARKVLRWEPVWNLRDGLEITYRWIEEQIRAKASA